MSYKFNFIRHVAIIMDGNGRWANLKGQKRFFGHKAGIKSVQKAINFAVQNKLEVLTLYAFSSENWNRPKQEVISLLKLFISALNSNVIKLHQHNIRLCFIGDITRFRKNWRNSIVNAENITKNNTGLVLNIAVNYSGRWDIVHGIKKIAELVQKGVLYPNQIEESIFEKYVCLNEVAPVDLIIRTGGEHRISNFLLWQIAYTEFYFTDVLWPDFNEQIFALAIKHFTQRERRFGCIYL
ncbi:MAG: polyprenyl diphosphate synthase [Candidatus Dasytiphilus stammeri]